ncbi:hypothetical protein HN592_05940 [Candidatus Woesearchaeota archaeon]|jgi:hypothetical protein|nr:hypothetical protein [Candidatus Woesearchaeota archaeon]MBT3304797.1 hypothetical protein [Candidatus Woesearchaeota archaeon]MBT4367867.1 hypothetical protein [Candidatus Woesearchaeota archaeon]MBT4712355.1 hypothetical protein [Candidatus Woesearchaeota archaeon]MBT6639267.1 hypothetical protein [Candidatus Woesearchaeota archaeon]
MAKEKPECKGFGFILILAGILFLLQDLNVWNFWGLSWYTVTLIVVGIKFAVMAVNK